MMEAMCLVTDGAFEERGEELSLRAAPPPTVSSGEDGHPLGGRLGIGCGGGEMRAPERVLSAGR